ncbi:MAG: hypothetical protein GY870_07115 [archaeon]|nr:hypothetical protein [archaeon]
MEPNVIKVLQPSGEVDDIIDYIVNNRLMAERGMGFTACQPSLVEIELKNETGKPVKAIKMGIDHTYIDGDTGQVMGYGIIGTVFLSYEDEKPENTKIYFMTPKEELENKIQYILKNEIEAQPRSRGKY